MKVLAVISFNHSSVDYFGNSHFPFQSILFIPSDTKTNKTWIWNLSKEALLDPLKFHSFHSVSFYCMWLSSFPTIYLRYCPFPHCISMAPCTKLIGNTCMQLFLGSLYCFVDPCVSLCQYHTYLICIAL